MNKFRRASSIDQRLRTVREEILPALLRDPADCSALRRLSGQAQAIRCIAKCKSSPVVLRTLAAELGNRLERVADKALKRPPFWLADRLYGLQVDCKKVHERRYIPL